MILFPFTLFSGTEYTAMSQKQIRSKFLQLSTSDVFSGTIFMDIRAVFVFAFRL